MHSIQAYIVLVLYNSLLTNRLTKYQMQITENYVFGVAFKHIPFIPNFVKVGELHQKLK
jgi:hypothetical protein